MSKQPAWLKKVKKGGNQKKEMLNIQLVNKNNVMLSGPYSIFGDSLKNIIKACEGKYIAEDKGWLVPRNYLESILSSMQNQELNIPINKIPGFVDKILHPFSGVIACKTKTATLKLEYHPADKIKQLSELPEEFTQKLYAFQKKGVEFGVRNYGRVLIADEMGVGKTIQALGIACMYKADWPFLVITPSSLRLNWRDEIFRWIVDMGPREVQVITKGATEIRSGIKALIISYDLASKMADQIDDFKFQMTIVDEAHYLKNGEAKRTENLVPIIRRCKRIVLLTGTPAFAKPKELFNLMHILRPDVFTNFKEFGIRYCDPKPNPFSGALDYNGAVNMKELHYILMNSVMIRRLKKDVLTELPPKRRQKIEVKLDNQYVKKIQDAISKSKGGQLSTIVESLVDTYMMPDESGYEAEADRFEEEKSRENPEVLQCYLYTGMAKIPGIKEYIHDLTQNDIKMLVFAHHFEVLNAIEDEVKKLKLRYIRIDGKVEVNKRYESVKLFQEDENVKIAILSLTAAGVGLTLTAASTVIFAEMYWTPAVMLQAEDRIHRMGQKNTVCVNYHYLYGEGTLDSLLYEKLQTKLAIVSEILEGKTEYLNVEETKEGMGDFQETPVPEPEKKKKKDAYGKEKRDSSSKPVGPANQITSYFSKKPTDSGGKLEPVNSSEKRNQNERSRSNGIDRVDSLDWDDIDAMLEKDKVQKSEKASLEKVPEPFNQNDEDEFDLDMIEQMCGQEKSQFKGQGSKEFEDSVFYDCLGEILEAERSKRDDSNNKDIRGFFNNKDSRARESTKKLIPVAEDDDEENGLLSLWKKDDVTPDNKTGKMIIEKHQQHQQDMWGTSEKTPPTRSLENSFSKKTMGNNNTSHAKSGPFRFSLQPKSRDQSESKLSQSFTSNEGKSSKKRTLEIIDMELEKENALEVGFTSNILKKVKITTNMGQILEGNDEESNNCNF